MGKDDVQVGELVTPAVPAKTPLLVIQWNPQLAGPISIEGGAILRGVDPLDGRVYEWTGKGWRHIGQEAEWIARRLEQLEAERKSLYKMLGTDAESVEQLIQRQLGVTIQSLQNQLQLAQRERDDYRTKFVDADRALRERPDLK